MSSHKRSPFFARPRDESLQSFKDWISDIYAHLTGNTQDHGTITEEQWVELHRKFWQNSGSAAQGEGGANA